jgi:uncharacterized protein YyaL (SSP411 family)
MQQFSSRALTLLGVLVVALAIPVKVHASVLPGSDQPIEQVWLNAWQQSSSEQASYVNRLILSDSAYLRQHADNPIDWYPWDDAAFFRANKENKLILISIGYASCHWCHVMEAESFSDAEVARVLNQALVSIKVDREQQPDIDAFFTMAVETINGDSGWPITMILLPDRTPVFAANYLSKEELITVVTRLNKFWQDQPDILKQNAALVAAEIEQRNKRHAKSSTKPETPWVDEAKQRLLASIDPVHGGFGQDTKFPSELKLQFLLNQYKESRDAGLKEVLIKQLNAQMNSGLSDVVYGGVFRYTTDRQMTRPHFEKMLYNQALTVSLYADAAIWLEIPAYKRYADSIIRFARQYMQLQDGTYAAAINADHEGQEGGYYLWPTEVIENLPRGLSKVPFGGGLYYLYRSTDVDQSSWRVDLHMYRNGPPEVIDNRITSWNALWVSALLNADETDEAESLAHTIWERAWSQNQLFRMGDQAGFLDDYSYLSSALWQLYLKTGDIEWKGKARMLDNRILDLFVQNGNISYRNKNQSGQYEIDVYQDKELPSSFAVTLNLFNNHQTELSFIETYEDLKAGASAAIGNRPEYYLTLIQATERNHAASEQIIAKGHGMVSLRSVEEPNQWQLVFNLDPGWHINASEVFDKRLLPTQVSGTENIRDIQYPQGSELSTDFSSDPLNVYSDSVLIGIATDKESPGLLLKVKLQACSNQVCLLPEEIQLAGHKTQ